MFFKLKTMKTLSDGTEVSARSYYYLLDWNEENRKEYIYKTFNKERLCDLTILEYRQLFCYATQIESLTFNKD